MMKKTILFFTLLLLLAPTLTFSAELNTGERVKLNSTILLEEREFQILLPENYHSNLGATYPVIYLMDGDYILHGVSGMLDFMANKAQLIPDVILVAIADKGTDKYRQYMTPAGLTAPFKEEDDGKAEKFLTFLTKEVKPYVNSNYRTANNAILVGHSMGGLFVFNALLESPDSFEHFVSISPSVWLNDHAIMAKAEAFIKKGKHKPTSLHLSLGDENRQGVYGVLQLLDEEQPKNIHWDFSHYPNENHNSVGLVSLRQDLRKIFEGWYVSDKELENIISAEQLISHYKSLSLALNINQPIPTASIKSAIRSFYRQEKTAEIPVFMTKVKSELPASEQAFIMMLASYTGHFDSPEAALKILLKSENRFNHSIAYLKSIASAYEQLKKTQLAFKYYKKALSLAKQYKSNQWEINIIEAKLLENQS
ncbi:putative esterase [Shewanella denitrificans OS217]|uniref:Putative esterase n=1 Tax=Shewanella denitrificans (strain OS217 / ATCC BAA-1090 / DSM 15013) TaxID=318161 RepID=Q12MF9_SHEDO|nr:alpha/beta fold hydrolase [Shewanella denitrificans]ABE55367.1 putative esterase [Shewanella denitrificans OS217]